jgi:hypothetical protein
LDIRKPVNKRLTEVIRREFGLHLASSDIIPTTLGSTTIDMVFTRHLSLNDVLNYVSYFHHRPLLALLDRNQEDNDNVDEQAPSTSKLQELE